MSRITGAVQFSYLGVVEGKITRYSTPTLSVDGVALTDLTINNSTGAGTTNILLFSN